MRLHNRFTTKSEKSHCLSPKPDFTPVSPCWETVWAAIPNRQIWGEGEDGGVSHCFWVFPTLKLVDTASILGGGRSSVVSPTLSLVPSPLTCLNSFQSFTLKISVGTDVWLFFLPLSYFCVSDARIAFEYTKQGKTMTETKYLRSGPGVYSSGHDIVDSSGCNRHVTHVFSHPLSNRVDQLSAFRQ